MFVFALAFILMAWWRMSRDRRSAPGPAPTPTPTPDTEGSSKKVGHPVAAASLLGGAYAVFSIWMFVAWYRHHKPLAKYKWGGDGWLGAEGYAGAADKFGHAWATMGLARLGTVILHGWGGIAKRKASIISALLSETLFTGVEVRDGTYYEFSFSDLSGDTTGAVMALLLDNFPKLDKLFDFRVEYFPSRMYLRKLVGTSRCPPDRCSRWNIAEDYSGQNYLAAFHLAGIPAVMNTKHSTWARFVDVAAMFRSNDYRPVPDPDLAWTPKQEIALGLSFNAQGFFDWLLEGSKSGAVENVRKVTHGVFEVANLPFTTLPLFRFSRDKKKPLKLARNGFQRSLTASAGGARQAFPMAPRFLGTRPSRIPQRTLPAADRG
jgi:hypothetical protein